MMAWYQILAGGVVFFAKLKTMHDKFRILCSLYSVILHIGKKFGPYFPFTLLLSFNFNSFLTLSLFQILLSSYFSINPSFNETQENICHEGKGLHFLRFWEGLNAKLLQVVLSRTAETAG